MSKVLYIKSNPKNEKDSNTLQMSERFIAEYRKKNPSDEIIVLDLYKQGINHLSVEELNKLFGDKQGKLFDYAKQFASADKYIIAAPMWNLSIPSILKSYIDRVVISDITFKYTATGPVGLLSGKNKKAVHISATGGIYSEGPANQYDFSDKYLRTIFGFMGVTDFSSVFCEKTGMLKGEDFKKNLEKSMSDIVKLAEHF